MDTSSPAREIATPIEQEPDVPYEHTTLLFDRNYPIAVQKYRCDVCHATVFRYFSRLKSKVPGRPGFAGPIIEVQCPGRLRRTREDGQVVKVFCKRRYCLTF